MNRADFGDGDEAPQFWATFLKASSFSLYFTDFQRITPLFLSCSVTVVLDSLCAQAGYVWSVSDNGKGHKIILVEYKS